MRETDSYLHWCTVSVNLSRPSELLLRFYITHTTMKAQFKQQNSLGQKGDFSFSQKFEVNLWTSEETIFHTIASTFECSIFVLAWLQLRLNDCEIATQLKKSSQWQQWYLGTWLERYKKGIIRADCNQNTCQKQYCNCEGYALSWSCNLSKDFQIRHCTLIAILMSFLNAICFSKCRTMRFSPKAFNYFITLEAMIQ